MGNQEYTYLDSKSGLDSQQIFGPESKPVKLYKHTKAALGAIFILILIVIVVIIAYDKFLR